MEKLYFVDGYHGGIDGHMPVGSWQDILEALDRMPEWTVSLDVEPESYGWIKHHDFEVYSRLREFIENEKTSHRIEFLNGCYAQPFCWAIDGESVIRQLVRGIGIIKKYFPTAKVDTYSVQEPCFTSQLPQIIKKLGFERMSLKNSTCWGGYMAKMPGSIVRLHAPDGTWMPSVVRYECEELYDCCATDASGYDRENVKTLAERCAALGIEAPNGLTYQDLGWLVQPMVEGFPVEFLTYRQYFEKFGHLMKGDVDFHQEDVLCALPWGSITLSTITGSVRKAEYELVRTEKLMLAVEHLIKPSSADLEKLARAWDDTMSSQHHDAYICGMSPRWIEHVNVKTSEAGKLLAEIRENIYETAQEADFVRRTDGNEIYLRVYNTLGNPVKETVSIRVGVPKGWRDAEVFDSKGRKILSSATGVTYSKFGYDEEGNLLSGDPIPKPRTYPDGTEEAFDISFEAEVPGIGYSTYRVVKSEEKLPGELAPLASVDENGVSVHTDRWDIFFDTSRGGAITRLVDVSDGTDYAADGPQGYLRGYFHEVGGMVDTLNAPAQAILYQNDPFAANIGFTLEINGHTVHTLVTVERRSPKINFLTTVDFVDHPENVGDPERPPEGAPMNHRRRSGYNEELKLAAVFNAGAGEKKVYKAAPYDVCESRLGDGTSFIDWGEIKHNMVNDYIDVCGENGRSIGLWCDRLTGYSLRGDTVTLTMGFGGYSGFFWDDYPLSGRPTLGYSLYPHKGSGFDAHTASVFAGCHEHLTVTRLPGVPRTFDDVVFTVNDPDLLTTAAVRDEKGWQLRLFNASDKSRAINCLSTAEGFKGVKCDLWGEPNGEDPSEAVKFEIITLR